MSFSESPFRICTTMADPMTDLMDNHMTDPMTDLIIMTVSIHDSLDSLHDTLAMFCQNIRLTTLIMPRVILMLETFSMGNRKPGDWCGRGWWLVGVGGAGNLLTNVVDTFITNVSLHLFPPLFFLWLH